MDLSYELIGEGRDLSWIVFCDHASNRVPEDVAGGDVCFVLGEDATAIGFTEGSHVLANG